MVSFLVMGAFRISYLGVRDGHLTCCRYVYDVVWSVSVSQVEVM